MEKVMNKLVRDKIPDIIRSNGDLPIYHTLSKNEYIQALKDKMLEEYQEILSAKTSDEILEECADLMELLFALTIANGFHEEDLLFARATKKEKRGGFEQKIYLEKTINDVKK